jgi:hypothetical protein
MLMIERKAEMVKKTLLKNTEINFYQEESYTKAHRTYDLRFDV